MFRRSPLRLFAALGVACVYTFVFGMVNVIDVAGAGNTIDVDTATKETSQTLPHLTAPAEETKETTLTKPLLIIPSKKPTTTTTANENEKETETASVTENDAPNEVTDEESSAPEETVFGSDSSSEVEHDDIPDDKTPQGNRPAWETEEYTETPAPQTEAPVTTTTTTRAPETEAPATTTTTTTTTTTRAPETEAPATTTTTEAPATEPSYEGETLFVYDQRSGSYVTGPALDIVARATCGEIWNIFPDEAVKAQAVAVYTYIKKNNLNGNYPTVALRAPGDVYQRIYDLTESVLGEAVYYNGTMIQSCYFASSCGYTNSSLQAWGVDYPYLRSVDCPLDGTAGDPNWGVVKQFTSADMKQRVANSLGINLTGDPSQWFKITSVLCDKPMGYVTGLSIGGVKTISGEKMRNSVMKYSIKSPAFTITYDKATDLFTITTYGYGHGVGLSQYGAKAMAENGYTYKQILQHYFQGTEIY